MFKELPKKIEVKIDIDNYNAEMKEAISKLDVKVDELNKVIDERTNKIREIEAELNKRKCYYFFVITVFEKDGIEARLSWERDHRSKKCHFRLFVEILKEGKTALKKILIESKLETKLEMVKYLEVFVEKFTEKLVKIQKELI